MHTHTAKTEDQIDSLVDVLFKLGDLVSKSMRKMTDQHKVRVCVCVCVCLYVCVCVCIRDCRNQA